MNLAELIAESAPKLGSAVSGKAGELVGEVAKSILTKIFNLPEKTTEQQVYDSILRNPEALVKLREAELQFEQKLIEAEIEFEKLAASDRDSARKMQIATSSKFPEILAVFIIGFTCFISYQILTVGVPDNVSEMVAGSIMQLFMGMTISIIGYFYGSSIANRGQQNDAARNITFVKGKK
jgi:hypothetical protein